MNLASLLASLLLFAFVAPASGPLLSSEDAAFLRQQARKFVQAARLEPGARRGKWRNMTPFVVHVPGANMGYPAFWVRDAVMMLGADFVPAEEIEGWIRLITSAIRPEDWNVKPDAVVPAYAVPDHINFDGRPTFFPGSYDSGSKQGGKPYGKYPPLDDHFYFITAVYHHWKLAASPALFRAMRLGELCERIYRVAPADANGVVIAGDVDSENAKDWGFCDTVFKSGKLLFPSVLKYNAANHLAELFLANGEKQKAQRYHGEARRLRKSIASTFRRPDGWLASATGVGNQPDVWGTAFAVWSGAVDQTTAKRASRALVAAYRAKTAVRSGLVRHILTTDRANGGLWQKGLAAPGTYQNGGYWSTPTGWYIAAMYLTDQPAARAMARDYIAYLRDNMRPDGMSQAWEWINPDTGKGANPLYVASVTLPYISLVQAGLVRHQPPR